VSLSIDALERFVETLVADPGRWEHLVRHDADARVYEPIWQDQDTNAWLICWSEDQDTGFHDHDASAAAIHVLEGRVREDRLRLWAPPETRVSVAGETFTVPPSAIHRVLHAGAGPAVTIHAYSPPLTRVGAYRVRGNGELERLAQSWDHELRADTEWRRDPALVTR
jgi:quercetin dioxygenase-like cupin family protein